MRLRNYQQYCLDAIRTHFRTSTDSVIVSASTGAGKTIIFSTLIQGIYSRVENFRVLILAHRKQLLEQAMDKLLTVAPDLWQRVGIYSAGLNQREMTSLITIAGIQSIYKKAFDFKGFDLVIIDEAHNIAPGEDTMYKSFLHDCVTNKNSCKILGFTATPYRMKGGSIYGKDQIFKKMIYKIGTGELIKQGHLCNVTARHAKASQDFSKVKLTGGDFNKLEVEMLLNKEVLVRETVKEILELSTGRKKVLIFCCSIKHAELVRDELGNGICSITHSKMEKAKRGFNEKEFTHGSRRFMVNVGVLTEGWDCPEVDCICLLRPTASPGLYVQMVGRGLRNSPGKENCLVLDFGQNIERHGAIDLVEEIMEKKKRQKIKPKDKCQMMKVCPSCESYIHIACRECLECGYKFPPREFTHDHKAGTGDIISKELEKIVTGVFCNIHKKEGKPDSLKVTYQCGLEFISEWVCLFHNGYPMRKAKWWWSSRFPGEAMPKKVSDINMRELEKKLFKITKGISVIKKWKFFEIKKYALDFKNNLQKRKV